MEHPGKPEPPLSPVLLAGFALRPLPPALLQPFLTLGMTLVRRRHPDLFERLSGVGATRFLIAPTDLPFAFLLVADAAAPALRAVDADTPADATIRGSLLTLVDLLEGRLDGDALFFSRDLAVEGDTGAIVALRNAVDDAEIDLAADVLSALGPASRPAEWVASRARDVFRRAERDLGALADALNAPARRRIAAQDAEIAALRAELDALRRERRG